jgi:hypothetical protein
LRLALTAHHARFKANFDDRARQFDRHSFGGASVILHFCFRLGRRYYLRPALSV